VGLIIYNSFSFVLSSGSRTDVVRLDADVRMKWLLLLPLLVFPCTPGEVSRRQTIGGALTASFKTTTGNQTW